MLLAAPVQLQLQFLRFPWSIHLPHPSTDSDTVQSSTSTHSAAVDQWFVPVLRRNSTCTVPLLGIFQFLADHVGRSAFGRGRDRVGSGVPNPRVGGFDAFDR
jgi:hypothetical protein